MLAWSISFVQEVISSSSVLQPHTISVVILKIAVQNSLAVLQEVQIFRPKLPKLGKFITKVHSRFFSDL